MSQPSAALRDYLSTARQFFEPQLRLMRLGKEQIEKQSLAELKESLDQINRAIANPEQFSTLNLKVTAHAGAVIASNMAEATVVIGILPILLERKREILDRIRAISPEEQLADARGVVEEKVSDPATREELVNMLSEFAAEQRKLAQEAISVDKTQMDAALRDIEIRERKWRMRRSLLEREPVAILIGGILLIVLTAALVIAMFTKVAPSELLSSAFLLILGFFFGQTTSSGGPTPSQ